MTQISWLMLFKEIIAMRFQVFTAVSMKVAVFWVVAPCSLVKVYWYSRGACYLHQGNELWSDGSSKVMSHHPDDGGSKHL
jgi:hypothetical protein